MCLIMHILSVFLVYSCLGNNLPLNLLVVALAAKLLDVLLTEALLSLTLLLENLYGLIERLDSRPFHLDLLKGGRKTKGDRK